MTDHERIAMLEAQVAAQAATIARLEAHIAALERQLHQDSHNSSKPPASDGFKRRPHPRPASGRKPGGQADHPGQTLRRQETVDQCIAQRPTHCAGCQQPLAQIPGRVVETRQIQDLPTIRLVITDHHLEAVICPTCGSETRGTFPPEAMASVQYGPRVRAAAVYLNEGQLLPDARTVEVLSDLFGVSLAEGSLETWVQQASARLAPFEQQVTAALTQAAVGHFDESGIRIGGKLPWLHTAATTLLTLLRWSVYRGKKATDAHQVLPHFHGFAVHDRWATYFQYACPHALCHAHLQRELTALAEAGEDWAAMLQQDLHAMYGLVATARQQGRPVEALEQAQCWRRFYAALNGGFAAHPLPPEAVPKGRGRPKRTPAENLLQALVDHAEAVMAFVEHPDVPLTNNIAEQALRMAKVQQKISGTFRSDAGATAFCRLRSYIATLRKQGMRIWAALSSLFSGEVVLPAFVDPS